MTGLTDLADSVMGAAGQGVGAKQPHTSTGQPVQKADVPSWLARLCCRLMSLFEIDGFQLRLL
jgi:hypothetical protein